MGHRFVACVLLAALMSEVVVPSSAVVSNPTGICKAKDNGARPKYHSPGPDDTYLPHCTAPLKHEYWRVFAVSWRSAYVIPRIDSFGVARKYGMCTDENHWAPLFKKYGLCKEVLDSVDVQMVNNMKPADALDITYALHEHLCFESQDTSGSWSIVPWGPEDDIHEVCSTTIDAGAASYCDEISRAFNCKGSCIEMAIVPSAAAIKVIVPGLNKLYGTNCTGSTPSTARSQFDDRTGSTPSTARSQFDGRLTSLLSIGVLALLHSMPLHA